VRAATHVATASRQGVEVARAEIVLGEGETGALDLAVVEAPPPSRDDTVLIVVITAVSVAVLIGAGVGVGVAATSTSESPVSGNLSPPILRFGP
jgi:hypothetical protein